MTNRMKRAALTPLEVYYHQFAVLSTAHGLPPVPPVPRPRRYRYPTFEGQLPCQLTSIKIDETKLATRQMLSEPVTGPTKHRPSMICRFGSCRSTKLKTFGCIVAFWSHIVNQHQDTDHHIRLEEIQKSAQSWWEYWNLHSKGGKRGNPTLAKIEEAQEEGFSWSSISSWSLRWG